jgi:nitrite reductase/ring-hydroxylating ferredoxin subunit
VWVATGIAESTLRPSAPRELLSGDQTVLLIRLEGAIVALEGICPHLGGLLGDGRLEGRRLTCPVHEAAFDARTGTVLADPFGVTPPVGGVDALRTYPTRVVHGMMEVDLRASAPG